MWLRKATNDEILHGINTYTYCYTWRKPSRNNIDIKNGEEKWLIELFKYQYWWWILPKDRRKTGWQYFRWNIAILNYQRIKRYNIAIRLTRNIIINGTQIYGRRIGRTIRVHLRDDSQSKCTREVLTCCSRENDNIRR